MPEEIQVRAINGSGQSCQQNQIICEESEMAKIAWSDALSVRIDTFDNEHKKLIDIFNRLDAAMAQGKSQHMLAGILAELSSYTETHFRHEEKIMQKHNYAGFAEHKMAHDEFIRQLSQTKSQFESGNVRLGIPVFNFLTAWIKNHIQQMDRRYSEDLINAGVK